MKLILLFATSALALDCSIKHKWACTKSKYCVWYKYKEAGVKKTGCKLNNGCDWPTKRLCSKNSQDCWYDTDDKTCHAKPVRYEHYSQKMSHSEALTFCNEKGGGLATVCTRKQHDDIRDSIGYHSSAWVNAWRDTYRTSNIMQWNGELPYDDKTCWTEAWASGEPNDYPTGPNKGEGCAELYSHGKLNDLPCSWDRSVICQFQAEHSTCTCKDCVWAVYRKDGVKHKKCIDKVANEGNCNVWPNKKYCEQADDCSWEDKACKGKNKYLYYPNERLGHADAITFCEDQGGVLPVMCTETQHKEIMDVIPKGYPKSCWVNGYRDTYRTSNVMKWNGTLPFDDPSCWAEGWYSGEPNDADVGPNDGEGCAEIMLRNSYQSWWGKLNDLPCSWERAVVCQLKDF